MYAQTQRQNKRLAKLNNTDYSGDPPISNTSPSSMEALETKEPPQHMHSPNSDVHARVDIFHTKMLHVPANALPTQV